MGANGHRSGGVVVGERGIQGETAGKDGRPFGRASFRRSRHSINQFTPHAENRKSQSGDQGRFGAAPARIMRFSGAILRRHIDEMSQ
jgi:hypothetical protein